MGSAQDMGDVRVGDSERESAQAALAEHLAAGRLDLDEFAQRVDRCLAARTRRDLLALFDDLPQPLPDLAAITPGAVASDITKPSPTSAVENVAPDAGDAVAVPIAVTILLGIPITVVLGFTYGAWWTLSIPIAVAVLLAIAEGIVSYRARR